MQGQRAVPSIFIEPHRARGGQWTQYTSVPHGHGLVHRLLWTCCWTHAMGTVAATSFLLGEKYSLCQRQQSAKSCTKSVFYDGVTPT